jgi:hypothetical protein
MYQRGGESPKKPTGLDLSQKKDPPGKWRVFFGKTV